MFWSCGRVGKTSMPWRRNLAFKTRKLQLEDTYRILKRSSKHLSESFNMVLRLNLNCRKDHLCHELCLQRTSVEDELKY